MNTGSAGERVLVLSHAHPDFSLGGGEIAAYNMYKAYREHADVEEAFFLGARVKGDAPTGAISLRRENDYTWSQRLGDWDMRGADRDATYSRFADFVRAVRPTIVHAHHYANLGVEVFRVVKQIDPSIKLYLTLHEYMAICANNGQMLKSKGTLCSRESLDECVQCHPHRTPEDFWLRKHFIQSAFELIDGFISPSEFLRQRYIAWGIPAEKIVMIENGQPREDSLPPRELRHGKTRNRFAYFGQVNKYKGLDTVLAALNAMPKKSRSKISLEIHGANLDLQEGAFQERVKGLLEPLLEEGVVHWAGPYQPHELAGRIAHADWVIVPSAWWENSPMVIQEALTFGRPLIVSNIGGMAEKVQDGVTGLHVPASNPLAWAETLTHAATMTEEWEAMRSNIEKPATHAEALQAHLDQFRRWDAEQELVKA